MISDLKITYYMYFVAEIWNTFYIIMIISVGSFDTH